jgi:hypothetical protein
VKQVIAVKWKDAHSSLTEFEAGELLPKLHKPWLRWTVGIMLLEDDSGISLATDLLHDLNGGDDTYQGHCFIPKGMIVETVAYYPSAELGDMD